MDYAGLTDQDIEAMLRGRTPEEAEIARTLLRRRRARDRRRNPGWRHERRQTWARPGTSAWTPEPARRRMDRRALADLAVRQGWEDMPSEAAGELALLCWCVARGCYDTAFARTLGS